MERNFEELIDESIAEFEEVSDNLEKLYDAKSHKFQSMLQFIYGRVFKPLDNPFPYRGRDGKRTVLDLDDVDTIERIWDIYSSLCSKYDKNPTMLRFSIMTGIGAKTLSSWKSGQFRSERHREFVERAAVESESYLVDSVESGNSIGSMFLLKSNFDYRDNAPVEVITHAESTQHKSIDELVRKYGQSELPKPPIDE